MTQVKKRGQTRDIAESNSAQGRITRSATMLNVVRRINRGVVRGEDATALIASAFEKLVASGNLSTAWLHLYRTSPDEPNNVAFGWGEAFGVLSKKMDEGWLPNCCRRALSDHAIVSIRSPKLSCGGCPLAESYSLGKDGTEETLTTTIQMDDVVLGFISVSFASNISQEEDRRFLLKELSDDIAFALRSIDIIRERERTEQALKKEALRRKVLMGASRDGICIFNQQHEVVEANQRFADMLGYTPEEVLTLHTWDFESVMNEAQIREAFADLTQTSDTFETKHRRKDGTLYDVEVSASGALVGDEPMVFTVSRDITEKKKLQASLVQSDRLANMGLLAAGVAHEINNPLAYVLYNLESLAGDMPYLLTELGERRAADGNGRFDTNALLDVENRLREALTGVRRIQAITRSLGAFSHVDKDRVVPVNISYVLECAVNMAFNEIKYRARLTTDYTQVPHVLADEGSLSQVFLNLLINAAHAIGEGNVEENEIRIATKQMDDTVCIEVRDTGEGIPAEDLERIFEPFYTTKGVGVGSGLGLAISKNIVSAYGGTISVESEVGNGARFCVFLPIGDSENVEETAPPPNPPVSLVSGRILLVDDEEMICRALTRMLKEHRVVAVRSGEKAKAILSADQNFDVVLCDMMMPDLTGMELHRWILGAHPTLASRVVFITGGAFTPNAQAYLERVHNPCFTKPFQIPALRETIAKLILELRSDSKVSV